MKQRLDKALVERGLATTRSQAENLVQLGRVTVDGVVVTKSGHMVRDDNVLQLTSRERYVSRAGLKLASVAEALGVDFADATVLDIGSSTGGFTDYALQHGARLVYAVDVGTDQLHPSLRDNARIELYEKTDIRDFTPVHTPDIIVMDVSFISVRDLLAALVRLGDTRTEYVLMIKPQFEAGKHQTNKGVIKNDTQRRAILHDVETALKQHFVIIDKKDSDVAGTKGNRERFYRLRKLSKR